MNKYIDLKCNICNYEGKMKILFSNISDIGNRKIILCPQCELEFLYPQLSNEEKNDLYNIDNYSGWGKDSENSILMKKEKFKNILKIISKYRNNGKLLDIGCGPGYLIEVAKDIGFDSYGIEISKNASKLAKERIGDKYIYNGTIDECNWKDNFDIITMIDLLEHVDNPIDTLNKCKSFLGSNNNKYIGICVPNTDSFVRKIMKNRWPSYMLEHLYYFNKKSIFKLAEKTGFNVVYYKPFFKDLTINYLNYQFQTHPIKIMGVNNIFKILSSIPIVNNFKFKAYLGEIFVILKNN